MNARRRRARDETRTLLRRATEDKLIRAKGFMGCSVLVECGNVQISNSQQPISICPAIIEYWILDNGYWIIAHFIPTIHCLQIRFRAVDTLAPNIREISCDSVIKSASFVFST